MSTTTPEGPEPSTAVRRSLAERFAASSTSTRTERTDVPRSSPSAASADAGRSAASPASAPGAGADSQAAAEPVSPGRPSEQEDRTRVASPPRATSAESAALPVEGPRRVRLSLSRVDPWSIMKLAFLMSVAIGIGIVVATAVVWFVLDSMHVFADIEELLASIGSADLLQLMSYLEFDRVVSMATIIAVVDVLLLTALSTIGAFVYNLVAALVGGLHVTLTDD